MRETDKKAILPREVTTISKLMDLLRRPSLTKSAQYRIVLTIEGIPQELNKSLELKANQYLQSCGCKEGMITGISFMFGSIVIRHFYGFSLSSFLINSGFYFLIGAVLGKLTTYFFLYSIVILEIRKVNIYLSKTKIE